MTKLDINETYLKILKNIIDEEAPGTIVLAYGSRVNGAFHEGSDLDLVIRNLNVTNKTPASIIKRIRERLSNSNIPFFVDIVYWENLPDSFKKEIEKKYIVI